MKKVLVSTSEATSVKEFGKKACDAAQVEGKYMVRVGGFAVYFLEMMGKVDEAEVEVVVEKEKEQEGSKRRLEEEEEEEEEGGEKRVKIEKEKDEEEEAVMIPARRIAEIRKGEKVVEVLKKRYMKSMEWKEQKERGMQRAESM